MNKSIGRYRVIDDENKNDWDYVSDGNSRRIEDSIREYAFNYDLKIEYEIYNLCDYGVIDYK